MEMFYLVFRKYTLLFEMSLGNAVRMSPDFAHVRTTEIERRAAANMRLAKKRVQCLNEALFFVSSSVQADSFPVQISSSLYNIWPVESKCFYAIVIFMVRSGTDLRYIQDFSLRIKTIQIYIHVFTKSIHQIKIPF